MIIKGILAAAFMGLVVLMCHVWASQPVVYKSLSTGEIVKIYGSDTMPDKYELVWVK